MPKAHTLDNKKFGKLLVLERVESKNGCTHWKCLCDCGNIGNHSGPSLVKGTATSCGCSRRGPKSFAGPLSSVYSDYKCGARNRKLIFLLSFEEFKTITSQNCHYCGRPPEERVRKWPLIINGVDRKESDIGYTLDNCVPCCKICNKAKMDTPYDEFIAWINDLWNFQKSKKRQK